MYKTQNIVDDLYYSCYTESTERCVLCTTEPVVNMYRMWVLEDINYRVGDVDCSGSITIKDATAIQKHIAGLEY